MRKQTKIILAAPVLIITFFVGTLIYIFWPFDVSPLLHKSEDRTFKLLTQRSTQRDGVSYYSREYETSNGQGLYFDSLSYASEQEARASFSESLHFAEILEQASLLDAEGHHVGDRAVIRMPPNTEGRQNLVVYILKGKTVYSVCGESLGKVLELEKSLGI